MKNNKVLLRRQIKYVYICHVLKIVHALKWHKVGWVFVWHAFLQQIDNMIPAKQLANL